MVQNCVRSCFGQDIDMEHIVNLPLGRKFESVGQVRELILNPERAMSFASELRGRFISHAVGSFEPNRISNLKTGVVAFPFVVRPF